MPLNKETKGNDKNPKTLKNLKNVIINLKWAQLLNTKA